MYSQVNGNQVPRKLFFPIMLAGAVMLSGCWNSNTVSKSSVSQASEADKIASWQMQSRDKMRETLKDGDSAKYEGVHVYRLTGNDGQPSGYAFCGKVNSKNSYGAYDGYERFVANPSMVGLESQIDGFESVWSRLCAPSSEVEKVAW